MVSLLCHLHFWTLKALSPGTATGSDIGTHTYHEKTVSEFEECNFDICRREWAQARGITWNPKNKRPERLRDTLRESEQLLSNHPPICMKWKALRHCLVLLKDGTLLTYTVAKHCGDVERLFIDRSLVALLPGNVENALFLTNGLLLTLAGDDRLVSVSLKRASSIDSVRVPLTLTKSNSGRKLEKLSSQNPTISFLNWKGVSGCIGSRHVVANSRGDMVAVWWIDSGEFGEDMNNIAFFTKNSSSGLLEYSFSTATEYPPVDVQFSKIKSHVLYTVERVSDSSFTCYSYECGERKVAKIFVEARLTTDSNILVCDRSKEETKLLLGCEDGTLILHDCMLQSQAELTVKTYISPISHIKWHPAGSFVFVCSSRGDVQCYDLGLNPIMFQTLSENPSPTPLLQLSSHFTAPVRLEKVGWGSEPGKGEGHGGCYDNFMMVFERGPVVLLRLELGVISRGNIGPVELVSEYIRHNKMEKAVSILANLDWNSQPNDCLICFTFIMDHLLIQQLSPETEDLIEATLATFLNSDRPILAHVRDAYKQHVTNLTRRFVHLLIRHCRLEKAFRYAVDLEAKDLCMDVHFMAVDCNELELAEKAKEKAESISASFLTDVLQAAGLSHRGQPPSTLKLNIGGRGEVLGSPVRHIMDSSSLLSLGSAASPLLEQAVMFESDNSSATPSHSELESDNEPTT